MHSEGARAMEEEAEDHERIELAPVIGPALNAMTMETDDNPPGVSHRRGRWARPKCRTSPKQRRVLKYVFGVTVLIMIFVSLGIPFMWKKQYIMVTFHLDVCGVESEESFWGFSKHADFLNGTNILRKCPAHMRMDEKVLGFALEQLECMSPPDSNLTAVIYIDHAPATFPPSEVQQFPFVLVPVRNNQTEILKAKMDILKSCNEGPALLTAAARGDLQSMKILLNNSANVDYQDKDGVTPLIAATNGSHIDAVAYLHEMGANINSATWTGFTALHFAAQTKNVNMAELLLMEGADLEAATFLGETPLYVAGRTRGAKAMVRFLVEVGAQVNISRTEDSKGYLDIIQMLIQNATGDSIINLFVDELNGKKNSSCRQLGVQPTPGCAAFDLLKLGNSTYEETKLIHEGIAVVLTTEVPKFNIDFQATKSECCQGKSLLSVAITIQDHNIVKILMDAGADPNLPDVGSDIAALHQACNVNSHMVNLLLQYPTVLVDLEDGIGYAPLLYCVYLKNFEGMKALIDKGADVNHRSGDNYTALMEALSDKDIPSALWLVEKEADVNAFDTDYKSVLMYSTFITDPSIMKRLIEKGANIGYKTPAGWTALTYAIINNNSPLVRFMVSNKYGDVRAKDTEGKTAVYKASELGKPHMVELLLQLGMDQIDVADLKGLTPLHAAASKNKVPTVKVLLAHNANHKLKTKNGETAEDLAHINGYDLIIDLLRSASK